MTCFSNCGSRRDFGRNEGSNCVQKFGVRAVLSVTQKGGMWHAHVAGDTL